MRVDEVEMDEMWSFVQSKRQQRWHWHAIDHQTGVVLAYVLAPHEDAALSALMSFSHPLASNRLTPIGGGILAVARAEHHIEPSPKSL